MRVKSFLVENLGSVGGKIRAELGDEAVILSTKQLTDGRFEVIAASERSSSQMVRGSLKEKSYANLAVDKKHKSDTAGMANITANHIEILPEILKQVLFMLINNGMSKDLAVGFVQKSCKKWEKYDNPEQLLCDTIRYQVKTIGDIADGAHFFVGYPGEGKTSLIMKTAHFLRENGRAVAILNIDHTKIGAGDDLEKFSSWGNFPYLNINNLSDLAKLRKNGVVCLIDTPGNLGYDILSQQSIRDGIVHFVCDVSRSLPSSLWHGVQSKNSFLALTKVDYMTQSCKILEKYVSKGYPLSFISNGAKVPDDFEIAESNLLINLITGKKEGNTKKTWMSKLRKS